MFGLQYISWKDFFVFILFLTLGWYILLLIRIAVSDREFTEQLFEESETAANGQRDNYQPILVSAASFPSDRLNPFVAKAYPLDTSFYEEIWPEDGKELSKVLNGDPDTIKRLVNEINHKQ